MKCYFSQKPRANEDGVGFQIIRSSIFDLFCTYLYENSMNLQPYKGQALRVLLRSQPLQLCKFMLLLEVATARGTRLMLWLRELSPLIGPIDFGKKWPFLDNIM